MCITIAIKQERNMTNSAIKACQKNPSQIYKQKINIHQRRSDIRCESQQLLTFNNSNGFPG